jgi:hypothetical protein
MFLWLLLGSCLLAAVRDLGTVGWNTWKLLPAEQSDAIQRQLHAMIPESDRVAVTARHWHAFQGRNDWREAFFASRIHDQEILACEWLVLPKDCGRPDFLSAFELVRQVDTCVPSHYTYAFDLYRRRPEAFISAEADSLDVERSRRVPR